MIAKAGAKSDGMGNSQMGESWRCHFPESFFSQERLLQGDLVVHLCRHITPNIYSGNPSSDDSTEGAVLRRTCQGVGGGGSRYDDRSLACPYPWCCYICSACGYLFVSTFLVRCPSAKGLERRLRRSQRLQYFGGGKQEHAKCETNHLPDRPTSVLSIVVQQPCRLKREVPGSWYGADHERGNMIDLLCRVENQCRLQPEGPRAD